MSDRTADFDNDDDAIEPKYLTFMLGDICYGLHIEHVTEIIGMQRITAIPDTPHYVQGVFNLRGQVIPVIDMRLRFDMETLEYTERTCIVVIEVAEVSVGLVVDRVSEVIDITDAQIESADVLGARADSRYLSGVGKVGDDVKVLLHAAELLAADPSETSGVNELPPTPPAHGAPAAP